MTAAYPDFPFSPSGSIHVRYRRNAPPKYLNTINYTKMINYYLPVSQISGHIVSVTNW
ncbi:MAG: hypothetical protein HY802_01515 [Methanobacterium sp.]|nr:hypothetical protein [Methanobacterium sp.]